MTHRELKEPPVAEGRGEFLSFLGLFEYEEEEERGRGERAGKAIVIYQRPGVQPFSFIQSIILFLVSLVLLRIFYFLV